MSTPKVPQQLYDTYLKSLELDDAALKELAIKYGWQQREPRCITPASLLFSLCIESIQGDTSFNDIASTISKLQKGKSPSKQAVAARMNSSFLNLLEDLLAELISIKINCDNSKDEFAPLLSTYNRILVQDSTIVRLPCWLFDSFSGVSNAHSKVCNARIQASYDLKEMKFIAFEIGTYRKTDQLAAPDLELKPGDLVIRDRGYLNFAEFNRHIEAEADCVYRHKAGINYFDLETKEKIDLLNLLKKRKSLDYEVVFNEQNPTKLRLVAKPVSKQVAAERRRKLKKESRNKTPSAELLALCDWTIFITNIAKEIASFDTLLSIYGLRWRIEIIFKTWKGSLHFAKIHRVSEIELKILLNIRLLLITEGTNILYRRCMIIIRQRYDKDLSLQKFLRRLSRDAELFEWINEALDSDDTEHEVWRQLSRYCCYDKRKRKNFNQRCRGEGDNSLS